MASEGFKLHHSSLICSSVLISGIGEWGLVSGVRLVGSGPGLYLVILSLSKYGG